MRQELKTDLKSTYLVFSVIVIVLFALFILGKMTMTGKLDTMLLLQSERYKTYMYGTKWSNFDLFLAFMKVKGIIVSRSD